MSDKNIGVPEIVTSAAVGVGAASTIALALRHPALSEKGIARMRTMAASPVGAMVEGIEVTQTISDKLHVPGAMNVLEEASRNYRSSSIIKKPLVAFNTLSTNTKIGVLIAAPLIGLGAGWVVHAMRSSRQDDAHLTR